MTKQERDEMMHSNWVAQMNAMGFDASGYMLDTQHPIMLVEERENCVYIPFDWLVKFCTHIDFKEPMSDEERAERWKEKLREQFGVNWDETD